MPSLKQFGHIHFMLWSLIVGEIKSIMLKVWKLKSRNRSSRPEMLSEKGFLRNFAKFTGQYLYQSLFFNKVAGLRRFPVNFAKFLSIPFLIEHLRWLLLTQCNTWCTSTKQLLQIIIMRYPISCGHKFMLALGALRTFAKFRKLTYNGRLYYFLDRRQSFQAY